MTAIHMSVVVLSCYWCLLKAHDYYPSVEQTDLWGYHSTDLFPSVWALNVIYNSESLLGPDTSAVLAKWRGEWRLTDQGVRIPAFHLRLLPLVTAFSCTLSSFDCILVHFLFVGLSSRALHLCVAVFSCISSLCYCLLVYFIIFVFHLWLLVYFILVLLSSRTLHLVTAFSCSSSSSFSSCDSLEAIILESTVFLLLTSWKEKSSLASNLTSTAVS